MLGRVWSGVVEMGLGGRVSEGWGGLLGCGCHSFWDGVNQDFVVVNACGMLVECLWNACGMLVKRIE